MSLFGASNNTNQPLANAFGSSNAASSQPPSGGLFGSSNQTSNQPGASGVNLFGGSNPSAQPTAGGAFASQNNMQTGQPAAGSLFGSLNTGANNQQQPGTSGLFGSGNASSTSQPATGGLFGSNNSSNAPSASQPTAGTLFGSTNNNQQQPSVGGLFGSSSNNAAQPGAGGGLFGASNNPTQSTGGLFGSTGNSSTQPTTAGLFGSNNTNTSQPATGGLFGSINTSAAQPTPGGLLGSTNSNAQPSTSGSGMFGSASTTSQPVSGGLFGNSTSSTPGTGGGLFGSTSSAATPAAGTSLFGQAKPTTIGGLLAPKSTATPAYQQADAQAQFVQLTGRIERVVAAWNPDSPQNRFQHYFYNLVDPAQVHLYGRQPNAHDDALWQRAVRENPDPSCLVPVLATSFDDLQKRVEAQAQQTTIHQERITETRTRIATLSDAHALRNAPRLAHAIATQARLAARLRALARHLHLLIPSLRSTPLAAEEEDLRIKLQEIESALRSGSIVGKMNELWARANALKNAGLASGERTRWTVVDEDGLAQLVQILAEQQAGLAHVTKILTKGLKDTRVIYGEEEEAPADRNSGSDLLQSFSQSVRVSTVRQ